MARIDDSHAPFKRTRRVGPGPKKRDAIKKTDDWECRKAPKTKGKYVQICTYVGSDRAQRGKKRKVTRKIAAKKKYNKLYRAWAKRNRAKLATKGPLPGYKCRKTAVAKCK